MELESSKVAKRVLSDQDMSSEQSAPSMATATNQQATAGNNRSSAARNNKRRVKRQKPRQKWNNYSNHSNNLTYNANLTHFHPNEYAQGQLNELNQMNELSQLNEMNSFNLNNPLNQFNSNLNQLTNMNNLNQSNFQNQNSFATLAPLNYQNLNQTNYPPPPPPNLSQPANFQGLNPISYPTINQNLNQNLNQNIPNQKPHQKRYHQFGNQHYNQAPQQHQHYQHKSNNNSHFNQNNRKIRKDIRKKREQWANRKQIKEGLHNANSNQMENSAQKQPFIKKRLQPAPNNTTSFLMDDHNVRESDLEKFKKLIRKETPKDGLEGTNDENSEQQPKINDRRLHTLNDESSSDEFYSSPDDEQDFMEKQFTETYDNIHAERLDSMSKTELIHEYLHLESKFSKLEDKLRNENMAANYQYTSEQSTTEEEQSNLNAIAVESTGNPADRADKTDVETTEDYTNSSLSANHRNQQSPSHAGAAAAAEQQAGNVIISRESVQQQPNKISLEQLQNEIKRLMKENSSLRRENEFLKRSNYNSNNESVLESDDQANRLPGGEPMLDFNERPNQMNSNQADPEESSEDNGESSSDSEESSEFDDEEESSELNSDMHSDEMNGDMNGINGHERMADNRWPQIEEENANLAPALEQRPAEDAEMRSNEN